MCPCGQASRCACCLAACPCSAATASLQRRVVAVSKSERAPASSPPARHRRGLPSPEELERGVREPPRHVRPLRCVLPPVVCCVISVLLYAAGMRVASGARENVVLIGVWGHMPQRVRREICAPALGVPWECRGPRAWRTLPGHRHRKGHCRSFAPDLIEHFTLCVELYSC